MVLDFDGVVLESLAVKGHAFRELFAEYPQHLDAIEQFHYDNAGMSRYEKFTWIYAELLRRSLPDEEMRALDIRFRGLVADAMRSCPFVTGAVEFIDAHKDREPLFIASGTPEDELRAIVSDRGLAARFAASTARPDRKPNCSARSRVKSRPNRLCCCSWATAARTGKRRPRYTCLSLRAFLRVAARRSPRRQWRSSGDLRDLERLWAPDVTLLVVDGPQASADIDVAVGCCGSTVDVLVWGGGAHAGGACHQCAWSAPAPPLARCRLMRRAVPAGARAIHPVQRELAAAADWFGRSFRREFASGHCSLWWFTELSQKNPGTRPTFARLCQLEALRFALDAAAYDDVVLVSRDRDHVRRARASLPSPRRAGRRAAARPTGGSGLYAAAARTPQAGGNRHGGRRSRPMAPLPIVPRDQDSARAGSHFTRGIRRSGVPGAACSGTATTWTSSIAHAGTPPWHAYYVCTLPAPTLRTLRSNLARAVEAARSSPGEYCFLERACSMRDVFRIYSDLRQLRDTGGSNVSTVPSGGRSIGMASTSFQSPATTSASP